MGRSTAKGEAQVVFPHGCVGGFHGEGEDFLALSLNYLQFLARFNRLALAVISLRISYHSWYLLPGVLSLAICVS